MGLLFVALFHHPSELLFQASKLVPSQSTSQPVLE